MKAGTYQRWLETPESARSGYLSVSKTRNAIARNESGATILSSGMPPTLTFAGEESYRSGRRSGKTNAATQTIHTHTTPASTPSASQGWNVFPTIAGRLQNANDATIRIVRKSLLKTSEAMKWYQGPVGIV